MMASQRYGDEFKKMANFVKTGDVDKAPAPSPKKKPRKSGFG